MQKLIANPREEKEKEKENGSNEQFKGDLQL